jgi:recombination protein RecA
MAKKENQIDIARADIEKTFGSGSIFMLGDDPSMDVERITSGNFALDRALGGGYARGSIVELFGPPGSGKSSLALTLVGQVQAAGGTCVYIDAEHGMNKELAVKCGVDVDSLLFSQPSCGEEGLEIVQRMCKVPGIDVIVVDSVAALTPRAEIAGEIGDSHIGLQARMMSQALRIITASMNDTKTDTIIVFINQIREKIGGMAFGPQTTTSGGRALVFYASLRAEVIKMKQIKKGEDVVGHEVKVKVLKNRFAPPMRTAEFDMLYDVGISDASGILKIAESLGFIVKNGSWYADASTGEKLGQGYLAAVSFLQENPEALNYLIDRISNEA